MDPVGLCLEILHATRKLVRFSGGVFRQVQTNKQDGSRMFPLYFSHNLLEGLITGMSCWLYMTKAEKKGRKFDFEVKREGEKILLLRRSSYLHIISRIIYQKFSANAIFNCLCSIPNSK